MDKDEMIVKLVDCVASIKQDLAAVKTDMAWLKKAFWLLTALVSANIASKIELFGP